MKTDIRFLSYLAQFFSEWEMFQTKVVQKIKTHILCSVTFFRKSCRLWDNVEKYCTAGQGTDDNMAHALFTLGICINSVYVCVCVCICICIYTYIYRVSQEECARLREGVPYVNPLKPELIPICYLLALLGAHHFLHVSRIRVKLLTFRLLMS